MVIVLQTGLRRTDTDMTRGSVLGQLVAFSVPLLIGNIFQQLYNTVDAVVVGNFVGKEALAAVGLAQGVHARARRGLAQGLGITDPVTSPTYTIVNEYLSGRIPLFHFDMYRLSSSDELFDIGWEDYLSRGGVCAVEWSENVEDALQDAIRITIEKDADEPDTRHITITGGPRFEDPCL